MPITPPNQLRVKQAIQWLKNNRSLLQKDIAKLMGITEVSFSRAVSTIGFQGNDNEKFVINFNEAVGNVFNLNWLMNGTQPMLAQDMPKDYVKDRESARTDELIASLKSQIADLRAQLVDKQNLCDEIKKRVDLLQKENDRLNALMQNTSVLGDYPFQVGVADKNEDVRPHV